MEASLWLKLAVYGCLGMLVEVFFTGFFNLLKGDAKATAQTYLWMMPIYGGGALLFESINAGLGWHPLLLALAQVPLIFGIEYAAGWTIKRLTGHCPWDYGEARFSLQGFIRLDYAPFWMGLALLFQPVSLGVQRLTLAFL